MIFTRYLLDFHHCGTVVLRDELKVIPGRLALALQLPDVRRELVEVDLRGPRHRADLNNIPIPPDYASNGGGHG